MIIIISIEGEESNTEKNMYENLANEINRYSTSKTYDIHFYGIGHRKASNKSHVKGR